jgi:hypothetical protein
MGISLLEFHIYTQLSNIRLHTQFFTTVTLVQFCVSKSPAFNVIFLVTVQLGCNNTEVVNPLHPELIHNSPTHSNTLPRGSSSLQSVVTKSECGAKKCALIIH